MFAIRNPLAVLREYRMASLAYPSEFMFDAFGSTRTISGESISPGNATSIADVFAAVNIISADVSLCPLKVWRNLDVTQTNPQNGVEEAPQHRAYRMLHDAPNPFTPAHRFWATATVHELLWGNWFIEKLRDPTGQVVELRLCDPSTTTVEFNEATGQKRFTITRLDGSQERHDADRILHGFGMTSNGLFGLSPITQCRQALGIVTARERFQAEVYGQMPYLGGTVGTDKSLSPKAVENIRASWRAIYGGPNTERHSIAVLEEGASFQPFTAPFVDMQFVESAQLSKTQIASIFKLPPSYLGGSTGDSLTYSTVEQNRIQKATQAVAPVCVNIAKFLSADPSIFPFPSWYCEFTLEGLMRGEPASRTAYYKGLKDAGVNLDPEYVARWENIPLDALKEPAPVPPALAANVGGNGQGNPTAVPVTLGPNG